MIRIEDADGVRLVTLVRPEARNALDRATYGQLRDALLGASSDDAVMVVIVTGEGAAFCAGQDVSEMTSSQGAASDADEAWAAVNGFLDALAECPKPLLAAVNGIATGIGATMLGLFDLVLVARSARIRFPFVDLGLVPEAGSTCTLPSLVGVEVAAHALLTGEWIDAERAVRIGLAWKMAEDAEVLDEATILGATLARKPLVSLVETKRLLVASRAASVRAAWCVRSRCSGPSWVVLPTVKPSGLSPRSAHRTSGICRAVTVGLIGCGRVDVTSGSLKPRRVSGRRPH